MLEAGAAKPFFHLLNEYGLLKALSPPLSRFLEKQESSLLPLLGAIDDEIKKRESIDRSLLLTTLIFPLFNEQIGEKTGEKPLHLGQIGEIAHRTIDQVFSPFFNIPRRMRGIMGFLMTSQYRFVPID